MLIIKWTILFIIVIISFLIGEKISKKYTNRLKELQEIKNALNIFKTKVRFTYEPIPEIFNQMSLTLLPNIANIFKKASDLMATKTAGDAWLEAIDKSDTNLIKEDIDIIKNLNKLLGKTDIEGQISEIELTTTFIDKQIENARDEQLKNVKMYKTLGLVVGLVIVIILV